MTELIPVNQEERFYLVKYERACQALAEAPSIDEIKAVHDFSIRMRLYARQSNNRNMAADAIVLQARAEREIGLLMRAQRDTFGLSYAGLVLNDRGLDRALAAGVDEVNVVVVALGMPVMFVNVLPPSVLTCHCTVIPGLPLAAAVNETGTPALTV